MSDPAGPSLTPSEELILECIRARMPDAEVAVRLGVPTGEAKERIAALVRKLGVVNRGALATWTEGGLAADHDELEAGEHPRSRSWSGRRAILSLGSALLAIAGLGVLITWSVVGQIKGDDGPFLTVTRQPNRDSESFRFNATRAAAFQTALAPDLATDPRFSAFLVAATPPPCIVVRSTTSGLPIACLEDGSRLRDLHESRTVQGTTWAKVETSDGQGGWVDSQYLK